MATQFEVRNLTITGTGEKEILIPLLKARGERLKEKILYVDDLVLYPSKAAIKGYIKTTSDDEYFDGYSKTKDESYFEILPGQRLRMSNDENPKMMKVGSIVLTEYTSGEIVNIQFVLDR